MVEPFMQILLLYSCKSYYYIHANLTIITLFHFEMFFINKTISVTY